MRKLIEVETNALTMLGWLLEQDEPEEFERPLKAIVQIELLDFREAHQEQVWVEASELLFRM